MDALKRGIVGESWKGWEILCFVGLTL